MRPGFTMVPKMWTDVMAERQTSRAALWVALHLLRVVRKQPTPVVKLTNVAMARYGVDGRAKRKALRELQEAGLVVVTQRPNRSPLVRVKWLA
jgi:ribosomal protein S25